MRRAAVPFLALALGGCSNFHFVPDTPIPWSSSFQPTVDTVVAGAIIGSRFHLISGMITSAAAGAGQDPKMEIHTSSHDVIELPR